MKKDEKHHGASDPAQRTTYWLAIVVGFIVLALSYSARAALGLTMPVWESELGWSRSLVSGAGAVALLVMAVVAPAAGHLTDRYGSRLILCIGLLTLAIGCGLCAAASSQFVFFIAFGGIAGTGFGIVAWNVVSVMVARMVETELGTATGIANTGSSAGQFLIVPILGLVLVATSWKWSFAGLAFAALSLIPVVWWLLASERRPNHADDSMAKSINPLTGNAWLVRSPVFHLLFWSFFLCGYTTTGVIETHFIPYSSFCGFGPVPSATAYGLLSVVNTAGVLLIGWLTDRLNRPLLLAAVYLIRGMTFIVLMNVGASFETLLLFAALFGVVDYSTVPVTVSLAASHLGIRVLGLTMGLIAAGHSIGGAFGAFVGGYIYDLALGYEWVWLSSVVMAVLAGLLVLLISEDGHAVDQINESNNRIWN